MSCIRLNPNVSDMIWRIIARVNWNVTRFIVPKKRKEWYLVKQPSLFLLFSIMLIKASYTILYTCTLVDDFVLVMILIKRWLWYTRRLFIVRTSNNSMLGMLKWFDMTIKNFFEEETELQILYVDPVGL